MLESKSKCRRCAQVISADDTLQLVCARQWEQVPTAAEQFYEFEGQLAVGRPISAHLHEHDRRAAPTSLPVGVCLSEPTS